MIWKTSWLCSELGLLTEVYSRMFYRGMYAVGQEAVVVDHLVEAENSELVKVTSRFYSVYFVPGLHKYLFSIGTLMQMGFECQGTKNAIGLYKGGIQCVHFTPVGKNSSIYILQTQRTKIATL